MWSVGNDPAKRDRSGVVPRGRGRHRYPGAIRKAVFRPVLRRGRLRLALSPLLQRWRPLVSWIKDQGSSASTDLAAVPTLVGGLVLVALLVGVFVGVLVVGGIVLVLAWGAS